MLSNTLRLNFCYLKIIHILHPHYHPEIIRHSLKHKRKNKCVCIHEIIWLIMMKMKTRIKNKSPRYSLHRPGCMIHGHKYSKYKKCLSMIMLICIKQHLSNIRSSIYKKVKTHWDLVEKNLCVYLKAHSSLSGNSLVIRLWVCKTNVQILLAAYCNCVYNNL